MKTERGLIIANGESRELDLPCLLGEFLSRLGWKPSQVVVEHNGVVLEKSLIATKELNAGDQIEIIVPVAGG